MQMSLYHRYDSTPVAPWLSCPELLSKSTEEFHPFFNFSSANLALLLLREGLGLLKSVAKLISQSGCLNPSAF